MFVALYVQSKFSKITYVLSIHDSETGRIAIYYGCVDAVVLLFYCWPEARFPGYSMMEFHNETNFSGSHTYTRLTVVSALLGLPI